MRKSADAAPPVVTRGGADAQRATGLRLDDFFPLHRDSDRKSHCFFSMLSDLYTLIAVYVGKALLKISNYLSNQEC